MYTEDGLAIKRNDAVLNVLPGELYTIKADELYTIKTHDRIPDNCKYLLALIKATQYQKQTNTGGLAKLLKLNIFAKLMLTVLM